MEVRDRLRIHGLNELVKEPKRPWYFLLLDQFKDLLVLMLIVSAIISLALGEYAASISILIIVMANAILGIVQVGFVFGFVPFRSVPFRFVPLRFVPLRFVPF